MSIFIVHNRGNVLGVLPGWADICAGLRELLVSPV